MQSLMNATRGSWRRLAVAMTTTRSVAAAAARSQRVHQHLRLPTQPVRCLATSEDAKLSSLLDNELQYEQQSPAASVQPPAGFELVERNGTCVTLAKQCIDGSVLEVFLDLNGSTTPPEEFGDGDEEAESEAAAMASMQRQQQQQQQQQAGDDSNSGDVGDSIEARPDLRFRVRKPGQSVSLIVNCSFPPPSVVADDTQSEEEAAYPTLSIDSVSLDGVGQQLGEYELEADLLNDELYRQLAEMLMERGVTRDFEDRLVQYCTAEEHRLYLRFLAEAKRFCDA